MGKSIKREGIPKGAHLEGKMPGYHRAICNADEGMNHLPSSVPRPNTEADTKALYKAEKSNRCYPDRDWLTQGKINGADTDSYRSVHSKSINSFRAPHFLDKEGSSEQNLGHFLDSQSRVLLLYIRLLF